MGYQKDAASVPSKTHCRRCQDGHCEHIYVTGACPAGWTTVGSVLLSSGQFIWSLPLLSIPTVGSGGWGFGLSYLPGNDIDGILGKNFNFTQNLFLIDLGGNVQLVMDDNTRETFALQGDGSYSSANNNTASILTRTDSGSPGDKFTLVSPDGTTSVFFGFDGSISTPGRIQSVTDRFGNGQTFVWQNTSGMIQVSSVTDTYGRVVNYRYFGSESGYRLREIEDFLGRKLNFQFDDAGRLVAVITPSINNAAPGNTFPDGTAYVFQYDAGNLRPERRDDLVNIWYPNQATPFITAGTRTVDVAAVSSGATPRYTIEYGQDPTDLDQYGKVLIETVGSTGVGGSYSYLYVASGLPF